jgi:hypothetical protein
MESQSTVRDGRKGEERMRITRGLGERQRMLERTRLRDGREERNEALQGIASPTDAKAFDEEWQATAAKHLPPGGVVASRGDRQSRRQQQRQAAAPPAQLEYPAEGRYT